MMMCGCGGVTPLILKFNQIRGISGSPPGRFTNEKVSRFLIFTECVPEGVWMLIGNFLHM